MRFKGPELFEAIHENSKKITWFDIGFHEFTLIRDDRKKPNMKGEGDDPIGFIPVDCVNRGWGYMGNMYSRQSSVLYSKNMTRPREEVAYTHVIVKFIDKNPEFYIHCSYFKKISCCGLFTIKIV